MGSEFIVASLDYYRDVRNALSEASFFELYGNMFALRAYETDMQRELPAVEPRQLPEVRAALSEIGKGGFAEAAARIGFILQRKGEPLPLSRLEMRADLARKHRALLPAGTPDQLRRIRGVQELIVRFEPEQALATLPALLADPADRARMLALVDAVVADVAASGQETTAGQALALERVRAVLAVPEGAGG